MKRLDRILMHGGTLATGLTGLAYAWIRYFMTNDDPFSAYNHPLQPWVLAAHVLAAPVLVFAVGAIFRDHVSSKLRGGAGTPLRRGGVATLVLVIPLILSGYLIQVVAAEGLRSASAWLHTGLGLAYLLFYALHLAGARRRAAAKARRAGEILPEGAAGSPETIWGRRAGRIPAS
ncbi:MAG TPA: hypothetical protein VNI57_13310 [Candidatus Saccharimonadales bacterium]|nr:hypothetical protein [Candidatus Saccharimonadales bacterium]